MCAKGITPNFLDFNFERTLYSHSEGSVPPPPGPHLSVAHAFSSRRRGSGALPSAPKRLVVPFGPMGEGVLGFSIPSIGSQGAYAALCALGRCVNEARPDCARAAQELETLGPRYAAALINGQLRTPQNDPCGLYARTLELARQSSDFVPSGPMSLQSSFSLPNFGPITTQPSVGSPSIGTSIIGAIGQLGSSFLNLQAQKELADAIKAQAMVNPAVQQQLAQALISTGQLSLAGPMSGVLGGLAGAAGGAAMSGLLEGAMSLFGGDGGSQFFTEKGRARRRITVMGPDGKVRFFEHAGAPVLFSRDLSAKRRVERIASKAKRGRRRNLRQVVCGTCQTIPCRGGHD